MRTLLLPIMLFILSLGSVVSAQDSYSPAISVNDKVISYYELSQRVAMLRTFNTPGDLDALAEEQLIEERLKQQALDAAGLRITDQGLQDAMEDFAGRANLPLNQFLRVLAQNGVAEETLRDFVRINVSWRDYIRSRFADQAQVSEREIDQAAGSSSNTSNIEVLLSEIIIPAPPPRARQAMATAERISRLTSTRAFEAESRRVSALASRTRGGRLDWLPITNYPPGLRSMILGLAPGEVTPPIPITNGVALFQMRGVREVPGSPPEPSAIEYATYYIAGGLSEDGIRQARRVARRVDTCDDLYGIARGQAPEVLERETLPPSQIPQDIAIELAKLDPGEVSYSLTRADGQTLVFLMLCGRTNTSAEGDDRDAIRNQLRSQQLTSYANALLEQMRSSAQITYY